VVSCHSAAFYRKDPAAQERLFKLLRGLMWRNSKADVVNEIELPAQKRTIIEVKFSPIEKYFYKKQSEQV
jgi:E3 ubiquitin-protein ligase SHPRH